MAVKNAVSKFWVLRPSSDTLLWSAWPAGDKPASGHLFLESMAAEWSEYQTALSTFFTPTSGYSRIDAQALVESIPTSGGTTLSAGSTASAINSALASNSIVFLSGGTYTLDTTIDVPASKWLIGVAGQTINLDCSGMGDPGYGMRWRAGAKVVNVNVLKPGGLGVWFDGDGSFGYKVSVQQCGYPGSVTTRYGIAFHGGGSGACFNVVLVSCEAIKSQGSTNGGGGDADGFDVGTQGGGNWQCIDCHAWYNADDGFDSWTGAASNFFYKCSAGKQGKNPDSATQGDGNGWKLGSGTPSHYLYKPSTDDNADWALNWNGNVGPHYVKQPNFANDDSGTYAFGPSDSDKFVVT